MAVRAGKSQCHPGRRVYKDGLCRACFKASVVSEHPKALRARVNRELLKMHEDAQYVSDVLRTVQAETFERLSEYADIHLEAAKIAALDGDAKPAEFALTHFASPKQPKKTAVIPRDKTETGAGGGVQVLIGLQLGQLSKDAVSVSGHVVDGEVVRADEE